MKEWHKTHFHSISNTKKQLQSKLQAIDHLKEWQNLSKEPSDKPTELKTHLRLILEEKEILWKTRAKQLWLKEADSNTKFFHAVANGRKRSNMIEAIKGDAGQHISNEKLKETHFFQSFKHLFRKP